MKDSLCCFYFISFGCRELVNVKFCALVLLWLIFYSSLTKLGECKLRDLWLSLIFGGSCINSSKNRSCKNVKMMVRLFEEYD